jgi:hypothetical protein
VDGADAAREFCARHWVTPERADLVGRRSRCIPLRDYRLGWQAR